MLRQLGVPVIDPAVLGDLAMHALRERVNGAQWVDLGRRTLPPLRMEPPDLDVR